MNRHTDLHIKDLLQRPVFRRAKWAAGISGGDRVVKWVHILEITNIAPFVSKHDLILSTGLWMKQDRRERLGYLEQLIRQEAAGLCVELGTSIDAIPEDVIAEAERHGFPLIVFEQPVRFVEITQDIHGLLINRQHRQLQYLEQFSRKFQQLTLQTTDIYACLRLLHEFTGKQTAYFSQAETHKFYPRVQAEQAGSLTSLFRKRLEGMADDKEPFAVDADSGGTGMQIHPVICFNQTLGHLALVQTGREDQTETQALILDIAAKAVATMLMRTMFIEERRLIGQSQLIRELIERRIDEEEQALARMGLRKTRMSAYYFIGGMLEIRYGSEEVRQEQMEADYQDMAVSLRALLRKHGLYSLIAVNEGRIYLLCAKEQIHSDSLAAMKQSLRRIVEELKKAPEEGEKGVALDAGFGKPQGRLVETYRSFREAEQTLEVTRAVPQMKDELFYDRLGLYQLLMAVPDRSLLDSYANEQLSLLQASDPDGQLQLLHTLDVYLDCRGSKQETADRLYIHRQTLYKRLEKLNELLGDFLEPHKRRSLELALLAYKLRGGSF
ncbi:PucR family transcriptional regulator [Paenibacillus thailandensis]|uniref:PucR family transcriptional regulator n=1 Tax=Paenibacillus thailandensis TaxID=393250 RepID=A0ABW5QVV3_9BACL